MRGTASVIKRTRNAVRDFCRARAPGLVRQVSTFHLTEDRKLLETVILTQLRRNPSGGAHPCCRLRVVYQAFINPGSTARSIGRWKSIRTSAATVRWTCCRCLEEPHRACAARLLFDAIVCNGVFMKTAMKRRGSGTLFQRLPALSASRRLVHPRLERHRRSASLSTLRKFGSCSLDAHTVSAAQPLTSRLTPAIGTPTRFPQALMHAHEACRRSQLLGRTRGCVAVLR